MSLRPGTTRYTGSYDHCYVRGTPGAVMLITVKQAAKMLTVSPSLVYALVADGTLPAVRFGTGRGTIRLEEEDVRRYLEATRVKPAVDHEFQHLRVT